MVGWSERKKMLWPYESTWEHCFKLKEGKFRLDTRKMKTLKHWHSLSREVVGVLFLETIKASLDGALSNLV